MKPIRYEMKTVSCKQGQSMRPIFKTEIFVDQSKANFDEKSLLGKITYLLDPQVRKCS